MKFFLPILFFCVISASHSYEIELKEDDLQKLYLPDDNKALFNLFNMAKGNDNGVIKAVINEYIDALFKQVDMFAVAKGLDPAKLPDISREILGANVSLTEGSLHGIGSINRTDDAVITYSPETKEMHVQFPIDLNRLYFEYHFQVRMFIIDIEGHLKGDIKDFKANVGIGFSFVKENATIDYVNTEGMGPITLTFDDDTQIAKVLNVITEFVTKILHPVIEAIIKQIIIFVANTVVATIDDSIHHFLHPNHTSITFQ